MICHEGTQCKDMEDLFKETLRIPYEQLVNSFFPQTNTVCCTFGSQTFLLIPNGCLHPLQHVQSSVVVFFHELESHSHGLRL